MEHFLLRLIPDRARVVKNQVSLFNGLHLPVAFMHQGANDFFRVMHVHLAAEGFEVEGLVWGSGHIHKYNRPCYPEDRVLCGPKDYGLVRSAQSPAKCIGPSLG